MARESSSAKERVAKGRVAKILPRDLLLLEPGVTLTRKSALSMCEPSVAAGMLRARVRKALAVMGEGVAGEERGISMVWFGAGTTIGDGERTSELGARA